MKKGCVSSIHSKEGFFISLFFGSHYVKEGGGIGSQKITPKGADAVIKHCGGVDVVVLLKVA